MSSIHKRLLKARIIKSTLQEEEEREKQVLNAIITEEAKDIFGKLELECDLVMEMTLGKHDMLKDTQHSKPNFLQLTDSSIVDGNITLDLDYESVGLNIPIIGGYNNEELQRYIFSGLKCNCRLNRPLFVLIRLHGYESYYVTRDSRGRACTYSKTMLLDCLLQSLVKFGFKDIHILDNSCMTETENVSIKSDYGWLSRGEAITHGQCECSKGITRYRFADKSGSAWETGSLFNRRSLPTVLLKMCYLHMYPLCLRCFIRRNFEAIETHHNVKVSTFSTGLEDFHELLKYDIDYDDIEVVSYEGNQYDGVNDSNLYDVEDRPRFPSVVSAIGSKQVMCLGGLHVLC